jgi:hypothetical protein
VLKRETRNEKRCHMVSSRSHAYHERDMLQSLMYLMRNCLPFQLASNNHFSLNLITRLSYAALVEIENQFGVCVMNMTSSTSNRGLEKTRNSCGVISSWGAISSGNFLLSAGTRMSRFILEWSLTQNTRNNGPTVRSCCIFCSLVPFLQFNWRGRAIVRVRAQKAVDEPADFHNHAAGRTEQRNGRS